MEKQAHQNNEKINKLKEALDQAQKDCDLKWEAYVKARETRYQAEEAYKQGKESPQL